MDRTKQALYSESDNEVVAGGERGFKRCLSVQQLPLDRLLLEIELGLVPIRILILKTYLKTLERERRKIASQHSMVGFKQRY